ncbi:MAG: hypothetical protein U9Q88_00970 [Bacillota bacterium]|nr:hypothetical protein [Bacillota bacterium]
MKYSEQAFMDLHNEFIRCWDEAMANGKTEKLEAFYDKDFYHVVVFTTDDAKPMEFDYDQSIAGLKESVKALIGSEKRFDNRVVRMQDHVRASVFYEMVVIQGNDEVTRIFTIEGWTLIDNQWNVTREVNKIIK